MDKLQSILVTSNSKNESSFDMSSLGPRRSIVRRIGSQLPLGSATRPTFELLPNGSHIVRASDRKKATFSLADIIQLDEATDSVPIRASSSTPNLNDTVVADIPVTSSISAVSVTSSASQDHMVTKISALEDELAFLRSQIAVLVTNQQNQAANASSFNVSISSNLEPPNCTSTPIKAQGSVPPCPPPPPPPPPPLPAMGEKKEYLSVQDFIRLRKQGKSANSEDPAVRRTKSQSSVPSMSDVLKDLHKVKLRSVSRSPGGTPFNKKKNDSGPVAGDPASLIAAALKKKFAHRKNFDSPKDDRDDSSFDLNHITPNKKFQSPETPKFGQHLLRRRNTSPVPSVKPKPELASFLKKKSLVTAKPTS